MIHPKGSVSSKTFLHFCYAFKPATCRYIDLFHTSYMDGMDYIFAIYFNKWFLQRSLLKRFTSCWPLVGGNGTALLKERLRNQLEAKKAGWTSNFFWSFVSFDGSTWTNHPNILLIFVIKLWSRRNTQDIIYIYIYLFYTLNPNDLYVCPKTRPVPFKTRSKN